MMKLLMIRCKTRRGYEHNVNNVNKVFACSINKKFFFVFSEKCEPNAGNPGQHFRSGKERKLCCIKGWQGDLK